MHLRKDPSAQILELSRHQAGVVSQGQLAAAGYPAGAGRRWKREWWKDHGVVVELDGRLGHEQAFRDMARDNRLAISGLQTLRYGWHDVNERPCEVAWQLYEVLSARGWKGSRNRCARCRGTGLA